jgi:hypothetical protein
MAKLRDMMRNFLYENVEDEPETEEEETAAPEPVKQPEVQPQPAPAPVQAAPVQPVQPVQEEVKPVEEVVQVQEETTFYEQMQSLDAAHAQAKAQEKPARRKAATRVKRSTKPQKQSKQIEYQAVLSPIFGNMDDSKKDKSAIHDAINLPKPDASFDMVKVISPMYGSRKQEAAAAVQEVKKAAPAKDPGVKPGRKAVQEILLQQTAVEVVEPVTEKEAAAIEQPQTKAASAPKNLGDFLTREPVRSTSENKK